ncbi:unnamed protein product [Rotaria sordida]|uniref:Uncharacterized protein n=1 Tax=Rotaria sordida TaxID=392033 RepID=A0A813V7D8_9BILA|nr:unnamed protein product [Rotaria sordida]CAF0844574.1 unnamed protein product [Rotaria sordida]CAF0875608.1 unnamed protein product [Rotaria sordida]
MAEAAASLTDVTQPKLLAISFISSHKEKSLLIYGICTLNECSAKVHTDLYRQLFKTIGDHNHRPKKEKLKVHEFREKVKQRAINETTPIPRMFYLLFQSRFNRRVQVNHTNLWSFIKFQQDEEVHFHHMSVQFTTGSEARPKQAKTIVIQRRIANLDERYYDGVINAMEYLDGLSFTVAKQKK